jgi:hypothetical protein
VYILAVFLCLVFWLTGCKTLSYLCPLKKSVILFTIGDYSGKWISDGFEGVADEKCIEFSSPSKDEFCAISMGMWLKKPVTPKTYTEKDSKIEFYDLENDENVFNLGDNRTRIKIDLKEWSDKPRGLIEGEIEATLYDFKGKKYEMTGHFKAYQALGTINSLH